MNELHDWMRVNGAVPAELREEMIRQVGEQTRLALERTGRGLDLTGADLSGLDFTGCDLRSAIFNRAQLHGTKFVSANLSDATLICPGMERTDFTRANLSGAYIHALAAQVCKFDYADLSYLLDATGSLFHGCSMRNAQIRGSQLAGSMFYQCHLTNAFLDGSELQGAAINECDLSDASFAGASVSQLTITKCAMRDADFRQACGEGLTIHRSTSADGMLFGDAKLPALRLVRVNGRIDASGASAENFSAVECGLRTSNFRGFGGRCATFRDCDLSESDFRAAYLYRAMITGDPPSGMSLVGSEFTGANLVQAYLAADFTGARLRNAKMAYARLNQSVFDSANLTGAGLYEASMVKTSFKGAIMRAVSAPFFADRCAGLTEALDDATARECVVIMKAVTSLGKGGST